MARAAPSYPVGGATLRRVGMVAVLAVILLTLGPLLAVGLRAQNSTGLGAADWAAVRFTLIQALASAAISVALAVPVARALARRQFRGRGALITLLGAPFLLPTVVAILGLLAIFGRNGILNTALDALGLPQVQIYGFHGVVLAHVFFNLPLAVRLILQGWGSVPAEHFRLAASLGFGPRQVFSLIELPMLRRIAPGAFAVIWLICMTSFAVALTLGGGPRATTVELAIYQAMRFEFDLGRAALLALVQVGLCLGVGMVAWRVALPAVSSAGLGRVVQRWDADRMPARIMDAVWVGAATLFLLAPLMLIVGNGVMGLGDLDMDVAWAALRSLLVALGSAGLAIGLALAVCLARPGAVRIAEVLPLAVSSLVLGTGLFLLLRFVVVPTQYALPVTAVVNALMSLPFAVRALAPAVEQITADHGRLAASLGMTGRSWIRWVLLPGLRAPIGFSAGLAAAFSIGDLGVITLFSMPDQATLPMLMYQMMGSYRMEGAASVGLVLLTLTLGVFWLFDRGGRGHA